jgi:hypothetical protein
VRPAFSQRIDAGFNHVLGRVEIRFADFEMDDAFALALEGAGLVQDLKGSLSTEARHATSQLQFVLGGLCHDDENS